MMRCDASWRLAPNLTCTQHVLPLKDSSPVTAGEVYRGVAGGPVGIVGAKRIGGGPAGWHAATWRPHNPSAIEGRPLPPLLGAYTGESAVLYSQSTRGFCQAYLLSHVLKPSVVPSAPAPDADAVFFQQHPIQAR